MFNIRKAIFETNSSSTHSFIIISKTDLAKVKSGGIYCFKTRENLDEYDILNAEPESWIYSNYDYYVRNEDLVTRLGSFENGEKLIYSAEAQEI